MRPDGAEPERSIQYSPSQNLNSVAQVSLPSLVVKLANQSFLIKGLIHHVIYAVISPESGNKL